MPKTADTHRHWRLHDRWPAIDRTRWRAGTTAAHPLDIPAYGQDLAPASIASTERAYGRFLTWLDVSGALDWNAGPESRPTPARVAAYVCDILSGGYSQQTMLLLLSGLRAAMCILAPSQTWRWIMRPDDQSVVALLRHERTQIHVPESTELFRWGLRLIARGSALGTSRRALTTYRDGMLIALLAARPLRVRTLAALQIGQHVVRSARGWRLVLEPEDMKNRRTLEVPLPVTLEAPFEHYVAAVRPALLRDCDHAYLWPATHGRPMAQTAVGLTIRRRSIQEFGIEFGPHRFRHAAATSATTEAPDAPGLAAAMLAVGASMIRKHYDRSEDSIAATGYHRALAAERERLWAARPTTRP